MNLSFLNTLRAILVHGTFTAAGAAVGCTPSAISLQVRQLEEFFGQPLFDRSTRMVRPTPFAREIAAMVSLDMGVTVVPHPRHQLLRAYDLKVVALGRFAPHRRIAMVWRRMDDGNRKVAEIALLFETSSK